MIIIVKRKARPAIMRWIIQRPCMGYTAEAEAVEWHTVVKAQGRANPEGKLLEINIDFLYEDSALK